MDSDVTQTTGEEPGLTIDDEAQPMPATPAPRDDDVRQGDLAGSREYAEKLDKDLRGDEYIVRMDQDDRS